MKLEIDIPTHIHLLKLRWPLVTLLSRIERFDAIWPSLEQQEHHILNGLQVMAAQQCPWLSSKIDDLFLLELAICPDGIKAEAINDYKSLEFWFETEMDVPMVIKCILFGFYLKLIAPSDTKNTTLGFEAAVLKLIESDYSWVSHIKWLPIEDLGINEWMFYFLSVLRDEQQSLLRMIDGGGVRKKLTRNERLLLHIIEHNTGIQTASISKKLGKSAATTKRMLNKLIEKKLLEREGVGPATRYKIGLTDL